MLTYIVIAGAAFGVGCVLGSSLRTSDDGSAKLRRIERKLNLLLNNLGVKELPGLSPMVQDLARDPRQKIAAIKLHREETGCGLGEAKQDVEDFIHSQKLKE